MTELIEDPVIDPDQQEALSARYVIGLRLLLLDSGKVAVFDRDGLRLILDPYNSGFLLQNDLRPLLEADKARIDAYRPFDSEPLVLKSGANSAEDLGL